MERKNKTIGDIVDLVRGNTYQSVLLDQPGPVLLGLASIERNGGFRRDKLRTYGGPSSEKHLVYPGDMYVSLKDITQQAFLLGSIARVPNEIDVGRMTQDTVKLVFKNSGYPKELFYWVLRTPQYKEYCKGRALGTTNLSLSRDDFLSYELPEEGQELNEVVDLLENIERKIALNNQINQTMEQMAQSLFKSWFVDFDPVVDNALDAGFFEQDLEVSDELLRRAEARKVVRESSDFKPLPDDIRQLFPVAFEECSEPTLGLGGWVPEGWSHGSVGDIASYRAKRVDTLELTLNNYISTENMLVDRKGVQPATSLPTVSSVPAYTSGTILVSNIRPYFKKIWLAKDDGGYSNDVLGFETNDPDTEGYLFNLIYQDAFFDFMMATSKGSKMPRGDKKAILGWGLVVPPLSLRLFFSEKVNDFYTSANSRHHENITLNQLRDTLLPKLISGELRLSDIETKIAEEALI